MNPSQKAGNFRRRKTGKRMTKKDFHTKKIARMEAKKVVAKKVESKVYDINNIAFAIDNVPLTIFDMTAGMIRGVLDGNYIGDSITPTHLRIRWLVECADAYNSIRVIVIQNKAGGIPIGGTLLQFSGGINAPLSPYNTSFNETYRVLFDEFYSMVSAPGGATVTETSVLTGDIRIPSSKLRKITWTAPGVLSTGGIYLIFVSDSVVAAHPPGRFVSRLYYKDA